MTVRRTPWFILGYLAGTWHSSEAMPAATDGDKKETKPCLLLSRALRQGGLILSDDEEKQQIERCDKQLSRVQGLGEIIRSFQKPNK